MYADMIRQHLAALGLIGTDVRHVEAVMRVEHSTLDGLSPARFREEVDIAAECVRAMGPAESERLAQSFGL